jgi:hypothetical protein
VLGDPIFARRATGGAAGAGFAMWRAPTLLLAGIAVTASLVAVARGARDDLESRLTGVSNVEQRARCRRVFARVLSRVRSRRRRASMAAAIGASSLFGACSSPTGPGETVLLEGRLSAQGSQSHLVLVPRSGVATIMVVDLRKVLWDVTLGDSEPSLSLGVGDAGSGECVVTGWLVVKEGETYLWSLMLGERCVELSDPGTIPADGVLAYSVRLDLPG